MNTRRRKPKRINVGELLFLAQCRTALVPEPLQQWRFALSLGREWRWDFCWPCELVAVEINGGIWRKGGGAHSHPVTILRNMEKLNAGALLGWRVLHFSTDQVTQSTEAIDFTAKVLQARDRAGAGSPSGARREQGSALGTGERLDDTFGF